MKVARNPLCFLWKRYGVSHPNLAKHSKNRYIIFRGNEMAAKVKPVQPTEIKDKKIARQVIEEIRKPIPQSVYERHKQNAKFFDKMFKK